MKHLLRHSLGALLAAAIVSGCSDTSTQPTTGTPTDTARVMMTFDVETVAGESPFALESTLTSPGGVSYKVTKLRFFVSQFTMLDKTNTPVPVAMVDESGKPLKYNLALVDYEKPESRTLHILAPRGDYHGLAFSVGVPVVDSHGDSLNHADASQQTQPLDVDNDMYWGWSPGYIFLKIEGRAEIKGEWQSFFYHVGNDPRMAKVTLDGAMTVDSSGTARRTLRVDVNRIFVTPSGTISPDIGGSSTDRMAHMGPLADSVANNVAKSGFITLKQ